MKVKGGREMVIETLKAQIASLTEAMKEKDVPAKVMTTLKESSSSLQKLLAKAREAAKMAGEEEEEGYEAGMPGEEEEGGTVMPHKIAPGHKMTKTVTVKHDGPADGDGEEESGDEPDPKDDGDEKDEKDGAEESKKFYIQSLLKEAGIPKEICTTEELMKVSLKEAKAVIAKNKALIEVAKKAVGGNMDFVPVGEGHVEESTGGENLNSLFSGCAE